MTASQITKRLISGLLALCIMISMIPMSVFAAPSVSTSDTANNVQKVLSYANQMRNANIKSNYSTGGLTWDTEGKTDSWRYFNGVMLDAFMMVGGQENTNYVAEFFSDNLSSSGTPKNYKSGEVDSVPMALAMFDLFGTGKDTLYANAINYVYDQLQKQTVLGSEYGNNFWHKMNSSSWATWKLGLDGIYMASTFLMEYANALEEGKIKNSSVTANQIYDITYRRICWVADTMYDNATGLYHHGWNGSKGNGFFWGRGIGWYAVALVDIIDMMPAGQYKEGLISKLPKLFNGMIRYQDTNTGMWYNVVNYNSSNLTANNGNRLETSVSAMMAYAMMKAYNEGWVGESYGEAGLKAFNGTINNKMSGSAGNYTVKDTYRSSGVNTSAADYTKNPYTNNEAKGIGVLIMAATLANTTAEKLYHASIPEVTEPAPTEPAPTEPAPTEPAPTEPAPTEPAPTEPAPTEPAPTEPAPTEPAPTEPAPSTSKKVTVAAAGNGWISTTDGKVFTLDTNGVDFGSNNKYLVVGSNNNYALTLSGSTIGASAVTIQNNTITLQNPANYVFYFQNNSSKESGSYLLTRDGSKTVYHNTGNMYYGNDNKGYWHIGSGSNGAYQVYDTDYGTWYLNYGYVWGSNTTNRFAVSSTARTVRLFKNTESYARLADHSTQSIVAADEVTESMVLNGLVIEISADRSKVSKTVAVTEDMVTWTPDFDGSNNNYTGSVVYEGKTIGTITVSVNSAHTYVPVVTAPTCTEGGYTTYTCADCGDSYKNDYTEALGHTHETTTKAPTCTEVGTTVYTCHCGDTYTEVIPATGHSYDAVVTEPTCKEAGFTTHTCNICGESYVSDKTEATGHEYISETINATCGVDGSVTYTCHCGYNYTETIPATGNHKYSTKVVKPTCLEGGYTTYSCTVCGDTYDSNQTEALGHNHKAVTVDATCGKDGSITYTCVCGDTYTEIISATGDHNYVADVLKPTCLEGGYNTYTCAVCGHSYVGDKTEALGHDYIGVTTAPTCTETGCTVYTCSQCNDSYTADETAALGHRYDSVVTEPTCTEAGFTTNACSVCDHSYVSDEVKAPGHEHKAVTVDATCTEDGSITYTCHCGDRYTEMISATGHNYEAVVTDPTCTETGFTTNTCSVCDHSYVSDEVKALGHEHKAVTVDATCTEDGSITYTCHCGDTYTEVIPAAGHNYEAVVTEPTCTEDGFTTNTCSVCGHSYVSDEVKALGHEHKAVTVEATCAKDGSVTYTCVCGDAYTEVVPATGNHTYKAEVVKPTCTEAGYTTNICSVCGDSYVSDETAALGHSHNAVTVEATCGKDGVITYTCVCGDTYTEVVPATGNHTYKAEVVKPTCTEPGYTTNTCSVCGDSYVSDETAALGHSHKAVIEEATCGKDGVITYTCVCGDTYTEVVPATGNHTYKAEVVKPTCTEAGYTTNTCSVCGHSYVSDKTAALGHQYTSVVTDPTCEMEGYTTNTCTACDHSYVSDEVKAPGHEHKAVTVDATCTEDGSITYTCHCGDRYTEVISATGHNYEAVVTDPTCTEAGFTTSTCSVCDHSYVSDEVKALGHEHEAVTVDATCTEDGSITYTCHCGDTYTEVIPAAGHNYEAVVTEPTCTEAGFTTNTCSVCGHSYVSDEVKALGHEHKAVTVDATCTVDGSITYTCHCGDRYSDVIPATGHSYDAAITEPTCTETGYTTNTCSVCGHSYVSEETSALGHSHDAAVVEATCGKDGIITYTCDCGDVYTEVIPATGNHSYKAELVKPTCLTGGHTINTCGVCGHSYVSDETEALGHNHVALITEPTCTEPGFTTHTCSRCGDSYVDGNTAATGHIYDCKESGGYLIYTCGFCGDSYTESVAWNELPKTYKLDTNGIDVGVDHKYIVVGANNNQALTLSNNNISATAVTINGDTVTLSNPSKHEFYFMSNSRESGSYLLTQDGKNSVYHMGGNIYYGNDNKGYWHFGSSSKGAYQLYDFDNCNWFLNYGYVWGNDAVSRFAVSSTARTVRLYKATTSFARLSGEVHQTWDHASGITENEILSRVQLQISNDGNNVSETMAATAGSISWDKTFSGYTAGTYTATVSYQGSKVGTITVTITGEHTFETAVVEPSCTEKGHTSYVCVDCGYEKTENEVNALGHDYSCVENSGNRVYTCRRCAHSYTESLRTFKKLSYLINEKDHVITMYNNGQHYAVSHAGNKLSLVKVSVSDGMITSEITPDIVWSYSGNVMSYVSNNKTYYLYGDVNWSMWWNPTATLMISTSNSSSFAHYNNIGQLGSHYLCYSNGNVILSRNSSTVYCFVEQ